MAATHLRHAFKYPSEDEDEPDELDEEHQEQLISKLQVTDMQRSELYRKVFVLVPLVAALDFVRLFVFESTTAQQRLIALLSMSSALCTAYLLYFMPALAPARKDTVKGPIEQYLAPLNGSLAALLFLVAGLSWRRSSYGRAYQEALPAMIFGLTMYVRQQLAPLDLEELQKAKYDYKGA